MKLKLGLFLILIATGFLPVLAKPAKPGVLQTYQPDGTAINIILQGDEKRHVVFSEDSLILTLDKDGFFVFADIDKKGEIFPTGCREINAFQRSENTKQLLTGINQELLRNSIMQEIEINSRTILPGLADTRFPSIGDNRSLVILVEFNDMDFSLPDPYDYFYRMLNERGFADFGSTGSAKDYFVSNSNGIFNPQFDVYGPVKLSKNYSYYGKNTPQMSDIYAHFMVAEACELLDDEIDFSLYDCNDDGYVDNVYIFYAGYGESDGGSPDTIWPHSFDLEFMMTPPLHDGVKVNHYACSNELQTPTNKPDGIGSFCHEFCHVLGLPDLYSTNFSNAFTPGYWDILDVGSYNNESRTPPNFSSFARTALGWLSPETLSYGHQKLYPLDYSNTAYYVPTEKENEYFLLENRQRVGFDTFLPGHGMLIWHIDFNRKRWNENTVNNNKDHQYVDLIEADNQKNDRTYSGDPFPGSKNITEFSPTTVPAFKDWSNNDMPYRIFNITERKDGTIYFVSENYLSTGIFDIESEHDKLFTVYNLSGIKILDKAKSLEGLKPGFYIINGLKLRIK